MRSSGRMPQLTIFASGLNLPMFSLQNLIGRDNRFFELLEASAGEVKRAALAVRDLIEAPENGHKLTVFVEFRKADKRICDQINRMVCNTFITPFEREDIDILTGALSRISKVIKKFAERLLLLWPHFKAELFREQSVLLQQATDTLDEMVRQLRRPQLDVVQAANDRMHHYEGEADKLMLALLQELYSGKYEALQMIVLRDLFELIEKVIDRCRDAGNVIFQIVLKNS
jgi:uncharacterized protein Yka (UPF0111/DUF47 family)